MLGCPTMVLTFSFWFYRLNIKKVNLSLEVHYSEDELEVIFEEVFVLNVRYSECALFVE